MVQLGSFWYGLVRLTESVTVWYIKAPFGPVYFWYRLIRFGTVWYSLVQFGTVWNRVVLTGKGWFSIFAGTGRYSLVQFKHHTNKIYI